LPRGHLLEAGRIEEIDIDAVLDHADARGRAIRALSSAATGRGQRQWHHCSRRGVGQAIDGVFSFGSRA
jgi:hypothetical protein